MKNRLTKFFRAGWKRITAVLGGLAVLSLAVTNVDAIATTWTKYFGPTDEIPALDDAVNRPTPALGKNQTVQLELVQAPKEQEPDGPVYDIYLKNNGGEDILLTKIVYGDGYLYTSAGLSHGGSHKLSPDSSYEIPAAQPNGEAALSPPYLLKGMSRGAVRFRFASYKPSTRLGSALAFEIYDSSGNKVAAINVLRGK